MSENAIYVDDGAPLLTGEAEPMRGLFKALTDERISLFAPGDTSHAEHLRDMEHLLGPIHGRRARLVLDGVEVMAADIPEPEDYPLSYFAKKGMRFVSIQGEMGDTEEEQDVLTGPNALGVIDGIFPEQEHCLCFIMPQTGVGGFLSLAELNDPTRYRLAE